MSATIQVPSSALDEKAQRIERELFEHVADRDRLAIVKAPPGSGKTTLLLKAAHAAYKLKRRIAIATQTNSQANDICRRIAKQYASMPAVRFASDRASPLTFGGRVTWETVTKKLPSGPAVVIATSAKWGLVTIEDPFDVLFIEEAWQLSWADFMLLGQVAERFVMIGDPGQIPPVVSVDTARWETSPRPPHRAAPQVILEDPKLRWQKWELPATRRLPHDTAELVSPFYDFGFGAFAQPGDRTVLAERGGRSAEDRAIDLLREGSVAACTVETPDEGPPLEEDRAVAAQAVEIVKRLLDRNARVKIDGTTRRLEASDIGLAATHRVMNSTMSLALPKDLRGAVLVDTPERWQGLERPVMIVVHPLSSVVRPSSFDLETGRLCVMASRHLAGLMIVSRDHVAATLRSFIPTADQPLGRGDVSGRGLADNLTLWEKLEGAGHVVMAR